MNKVLWGAAAVYLECPGAVRVEWLRLVLRRPRCSGLLLWPALCRGSVADLPNHWIRLVVSGMPVAARSLGRFLVIPRHAL